MNQPVLGKADLTFPRFKIWYELNVFLILECNWMGKMEEGNLASKNQNIFRIGADDIYGVSDFLGGGGLWIKKMIYNFCF